MFYLVFCVLKTIKPLFVAYIIIIIGLYNFYYAKEFTAKKLELKISFLKNFAQTLV